MSAPASRIETATKEILILDDDGRVLRSSKRVIEKLGNYNVSLSANIHDAHRQVSEADYDLLLVDIHLKKESGGEDNGIDFIHAVRKDGFRKLIMVMSGDKSCAHFIRAAHAGANDYWVKLGGLDLIDAVNLIMKRFENGARRELRPIRVAEVCFFKCVRCTRNDCLYMQKYHDLKFPTFEELAKVMGVSFEAVKTRFSRIYDRLEIGSSSQLVEVLTACSFYRR